MRGALEQVSAQFRPPRTLRPSQSLIAKAPFSGVAPAFVASHPSPAMRPALLVVVACLVGAASGLTGLSQALRAGAKSVKPSSSRSTCGVQEASRRHLLLAGAAALPVMGSPIAAIASGGATAGKTTSIPRAKVASSSRASF